MPIQLALEIPIGLPQLRNLTDFDFVLAQELSHPEYRELVNDPPRPMSILDNGFHELGEPMDVLSLRAAWRLCRAQFVIAPDKLGDAPFTLRGFYDAYDAFRNDTNAVIVPVLCGQTRGDRYEFFQACEEHNDGPLQMLALPFREDRVRWFDQLASDGAIGPGELEIHLLGWQGPDELDYWKGLDRQGYPISMDTAKPIKWGIECKRMDGLQSVRGSLVPSKELSMMTDFSPAQVESILYNIALLRKMLSE
jgi:hypothetical protein